MPTFHTPEPISVTIDLGVGDVHIVASERSDTTVEVVPTDAAKKGDVSAAEHTRVEYSNGTLFIRAPKGWRQYTFRGGGESIDVQIALPAGSNVRAEAGTATIRGTGRLGDCQLKTGMGEIQLDQTGPVRLNTGAGVITVNRVSGHADIATASGSVQVGCIDGTAVIKNSNGDSSIGGITGDLRVKAANGKINVDLAQATVAATTAHGDIRLGEVVHGVVVAHTAFGKVEVGVRHGVAAWLDLNTTFGNVHNDLDTSDRPEPGEDTVEIRARTAFGDIDISRCPPSTDAPSDAT